MKRSRFQAVRGILWVALLLLMVALPVVCAAAGKDPAAALAEKQRINKYVWASSAVIVALVPLSLPFLLSKRRKSSAPKAESAAGKSAKGDVAAGAPIISVKNVTMEFKVTTSKTSGIKDFVIQLLKRQVKYRTLKALSDVSFDIQKGEIVGVIGTNGSGKSTVLRIVSGALRPTSGTVEVNAEKVQLLTLGTGFDMELTARENVYLNGALIGLSKEFIDTHFQEIVDFAELEDFMDEKVKNFSSGMVSRLGFAIATAGEAADVLILDEVLSVGDEFFRKKSLAKVKEMMHSGATVLLVSHSAQTIQENCTKAIWIEKGQLMMVGDPTEVCAAYKASNAK